MVCDAAALCVDGPLRVAASGACDGSVARAEPRGARQAARTPARAFERALLSNAHASARVNCARMTRADSVAPHHRLRLDGAAFLAREPALWRQCFRALKDGPRCGKKPVRKAVEKPSVVAAAAALFGAALSGGGLSTHVEARCLFSRPAVQPQYRFAILVGN